MEDLPIRRDRQALVNLLLEAGGKVQHANVRCPWHEDSNSSGYISRGGDDVWRYTCHAATCGVKGDYFDLLSHMSGRSVDDCIRDYRTETGGGQRSDRGRPSSPPPQSQAPKEEPRRKAYIYPTLEALKASFAGHHEEPCIAMDANNEKELWVEIRYFPPGAKSRKEKEIRQVLPAPGGGYIKNGPKPPWPLYGLPGVKASDQVLVCEGPKKARMAMHFGFAGVSAIGGADPKKVELSDWTPLAGKKVVLWPDNDEPGKKYMDALAAHLQKLSPRCEVKIIDPETLGTTDLPFDEKGDIVDYVNLLRTEGLEDDHISEAIKIAFRRATDLGAEGDFTRRIDDIITGRFQSLGLPFRGLYELSHPYIPGTITILCGDPGSNKSFFVALQLMWMQERGHKTAVFFMEKDRGMHLQRMAAMLEQSNRYIDTPWLNQNPDLARRFADKHKAFMGECGAHIWTDRIPPSKKNCVEWVQARCAEGYRLIVMDPITVAASFSREPWKEDHELMVALSIAATDSGSSLLLTTHPRHGSKTGPGLDDLAGGLSFARFCDTAWWLESLKEEKKYELDRWSGGHRESVTEEINRMVHVIKARNGKGTGMKLGMRWVPDALRLEEVGVARAEVKAKKQPREDAPQDDKRTTPYKRREGPDVSYGEQEKMAWD